MLIEREDLDGVQDARAGLRGVPCWRSIGFYCPFVCSGKDATKKQKTAPQSVRAVREPSTNLVFAEPKLLSHGKNRACTEKEK